MSGRILISTLPPFQGGVPAKARILCRHLKALGNDVTVAYYATFRHHPEANVPLWQVPRGMSPTVVAHRCFDDMPAAAVGCWLPELEAPYHLSSRRWQELIAGHDRHIAVGGNPLVALPFVLAGVPHLLWCASGVVTDRRDRHACMPWPRRAVDAAVIEPWLRVLEQRVLCARTPILGVSTYTLRVLAGLGCASDRLALLPIPVDCDRFRPPTQTPVATVGFAGRFEDPRKNLGLLLEAFARASATQPRLRLRLAGCEATPATWHEIDRRGLAERTDLVGELPPERLREFYQSLDVFVIPSFQEGFCIAGMEALASGVPVISTRCGGPEDFVRPGLTGFLVDEVDEMAARILEITSDRPLRSRLGHSARELAAQAYSPAAFAERLAAAWQSVWGERP